MKILRTPDGRFASLPDFKFAARYVEIPDVEGGATARFMEANP